MESCIKRLKVDGIEAGVTTIRNGDYPPPEESCIVTAGTEKSACPIFR